MKFRQPAIIIRVKYWTGRAGLRKRYFRLRITATEVSKQERFEATRILLHRSKKTGFAAMASIPCSEISNSILCRSRGISLVGLSSFPFQEPRVRRSVEYFSRGELKFFSRFELYGVDFLDIGWDLICFLDFSILIVVFNFLIFDMYLVEEVRKLEFVDLGLWNDENHRKN